MASDKATHIEPFLIGANEAARLLGVGKSMFYQMHSTGQLGPAPIAFGGKCKRWDVAELRRWVAAGCPNRDKWISRMGGQD